MVVHMVFGSLSGRAFQRYPQSISEAVDALLNDLLSILGSRVKSFERPLGRVFDMRLGGLLDGLSVLRADLRSTCSGPFTDLSTGLAP